MIGGPGDPPGGLHGIGGDAFAREVELAQQKLRFAVAKLGGLPAQYRRRIRVGLRTRVEQLHHRQQRLHVPARRCTIQPCLRLRGARGQRAVTAPIQLAEMEHRRGLSRLGRRAQQLERPLIVVANPLTVQQKQPQAEHCGRVITLYGFLEPLERTGGRARAPEAAGVKHPQSELSGGISLGCSRREPPLGRCQIEGRTESGCELIAESGLCARIAALRGEAVPMRRLLRIGANRKPLWKETIEQRAGLLRRIDLRLGRCRSRLRRFQADQINFAEPRLSGQRTLLRRGPEPAHRLDEAL